MEQLLKPLAPTAVIAAKVRELRKDRGWSAEQLAARMRAAGIEWTRLVVAKLETGRRQAVSVEELLSLAAVLGVSPLHLLVPPLPQPQLAAPGEPNDNAPYQVTPTQAVPCYQVRQWVRGYEPLPGADLLRYVQAMPVHEQPDAAEVERRIRVEEGHRDE
jgi:transcriptional regulator with XRE-family HTH domain